MESRDLGTEQEMERFNKRRERERDKVEWNEKKIRKGDRNKKQDWCDGNEAMRG